MTDITLVENNGLKKYLESYKRLFFRKQLDNPKSNLVLDKKRESLGLVKEEVKKMESLLHKNLCDCIDFTAAIMDLNASVELSSDDLVEINEYCKDLGLEEDDIKNCLQLAKEKYLSEEPIEVLGNSIKDVNVKQNQKDQEAKELLEQNIDISNKIDDLKQSQNNNSAKENVNKKKNKKRNKYKRNASDLDHIPSFKQRTREILEIDNCEISKANYTNTIINEEILQVEAIEVANSMEESSNEDVERDNYFNDIVLEDNDINLELNDEIVVEDVQKEDLEIKEVQAMDVQEVQDVENEVIVSEKGQLVDNRLFDNFDENIEVKKEIQESELTQKESTSFLRYDEEDVVSEQNTLDDILDLNSRDFRLETLKTLFYNGCLLCVAKFKDNIFSIRGRRGFTKENIRTAFYDSYEELIDYTHAFLTKEGINDNSIEKEQLFERIFGLQCLETLSKQINKINIMMDNSVSENQILSSIDRSIGIYRANSDKPHFRTFAVRSISRDIKAIFEQAKTDYNLRDSIEQGIYKLILEAVEFINKCGLANFDIYTEDNGRTLNTLLEAKSKTKEILVKYEDGKGVSNEKYIEIIKNAIVDYPFFEDSYLALSKVETVNIRKYNILCSAIELLNKCGEEAGNIIEEITSVEIILYAEEIKKIDVSASLEVKQALCMESAEAYKIRDFDTIFETEINHFGFVVSDIEIGSVSEETRLKAFRKDLYEIKEENYNDELRRDKIQESKGKYFIRNWECFKAEYAVFGKSFEGNVFADLDKQDRITIIDYCMKCIKEIAESGKEKRDGLVILQDKNILDKKEFRDIEKDVFGFVIPLNDEEIIEFDFMENINKIYNNSSEDIKALDIAIKNKKWEIEIPSFYASIMSVQSDYEPVIMVYTEDDKSGKHKEGFVITDRNIYSSYAKRFFKFSEIDAVKLKNYSKIKKGERISFDGIFVEIDHKDYKLCSNYMGTKDSFAKMLNDVLDAYRDVNGFAPLDRPEENIEHNMLLGIDSENMLFGNKRFQDELKVNLAENKYYELMSDLLNYDNISFKEVLIELSRLINKDLADKVYFSEITEGSGEKIREACSSYVMSISELEEIYLLIDNTKKFPLQFQKLGVVISSKGIYCKNRLEDAWMIDLKYANNIKTKDDNKIQITNRIIEFPHIKSKQELYELRDLIEFVVILRKIMDNPLEEIEEELGNMQISPAEKFTLELVNSVQSENLRRMLFIHSEGAASEKKYAAAMASYADLNDVENPVLLLDTTVFGVKTSGLLVTDKNIYYKEGMSNSLNINLLAVSRVYMKNDKFYINGIEFKLSSLNLTEKTELAQKLSKLVEFLKNTGFKRI